MKTIENHLSIHSNALNLRGKRNKILASNIANAATPHFKARDIDFGVEMRKKEKIGDISVNHEKHFALLSKVRPNAAKKPSKIISISLVPRRMERIWSLFSRIARASAREFSIPISAPPKLLSGAFPRRPCDQRIVLIVSLGFSIPKKDRSHPVKGHPGHLVAQHLRLLHSKAT